MIRKHGMLFLWVLGILLPLTWFTRFSSLYSRLFGYLFDPLWMHVLMHAFLFAVLAFLLVHRMAHRVAVAPQWCFALNVLGLVLIIALLQEGLQLLYKGRLPGVDELLDVGLDLAGGSLGVMAFWLQGNKVDHHLAK